MGSVGQIALLPESCRAGHVLYGIFGVLGTGYCLLIMVLAPLVDLRIVGRGQRSDSLKFGSESPMEG